MAAQRDAAQARAARAQNVPKILRLGVIQGGKIIEEKLLRKRAAVTIGTNPKCTISIPASDLPKTYNLFEVKGGGYTLTFTEQMTGRLTSKQGPMDFDALKSKGLATKRGSNFALPLDDTARGKVVVGDVTVLFQFVIPPPMPEQPKLPVGARASLLKSIDWFYAILMIGSFAIHLGSIVVFYNTPVPESLSLEELDDRWAQLLVPDMEKDKEKKDEGKDKEGEGQVKKKKQPKKAPKEEPSEKMNDDQKAKVKAANKAKAKKLVAGKGVLAILGTAGAGGAGGVVADVFGEGGASIKEGAFDGITGVSVASGDGKTTRRGASDTGSAAGIGDSATSGGGGGKVKTGKRKKLKVGTVRSSRPEVDGDLDPGKVARYVKMRIRSIKDCYERELKRNPKLRGKISISFTIETNGRVSEASVETNTMGNKTVARCITSRIRRWIFPRPKGGSVTVAYPFIFSPAG